MSLCLMLFQCWTKRECVYVCVFVFRWGTRVCCLRASPLKASGARLQSLMMVDEITADILKTRNMAKQSRRSVATELRFSHLCLPSCILLSSILLVFPSSCSADLFLAHDSMRISVRHACFTRSCWKSSAVKGRVHSRATWQTRCFLSVLKYSLLPDAALPNTTYAAVWGFRPDQLR